MITHVDINDWEFIIVRSLMELEHNQAHTYDVADLTAPEILLLNSVEATQVRVSCYVQGALTSLIYTVL